MRKRPARCLDSYVKDNSVAAVYDQVMVPALSLFEQDRHRNALDQETVNFITETTKEQVEELGLRSDEPQPANPPIDSVPGVSPPMSADKQPAPPSVLAKRVVCVAVRDDSDEIVALMLAQLLGRAGHSAKTIPLGNVDQVVDEVFDARPEVVCLSALPPYAHGLRANAVRGFASAPVKSRHCDWPVDHSGDLAKAAKVITGDQGYPVCVTLAEAVERVSLRNPSAKPEQKTDAAVAEARV